MLPFIGNMAPVERERAAEALEAFAESLNDKDDEYYLSRLADRLLGYSAAEEQ